MNNFTVYAVACYKFKMNRSNKAFSLIELSIVLVILGLLTGGILAGKSLIRAAEIRSVTTEFARYKTALHGFKDKYFTYPGDMPNATAFWGAANGGTGFETACFDIDSTDARTCNGNGDGFINSNYSQSVSNAYTWYWSHESLRLWQHLANAGFIEGTYTGNTRVTATVAPGINTPASRIPGGGFFIQYMDNHPGGSGFWDSNYGHTAFYSVFPKTSVITDSPWPFTPAETWNIDTKIDDGKPGYGTVMTTKTQAGGINCVTSTTQETAAYNLSENGKACMVLIKFGF